jgi:hypothetical protein
VTTLRGFSAGVPVIVLRESPPAKARKLGGRLGAATRAAYSLEELSEPVSEEKDDELAADSSDSDS